MRRVIAASAVAVGLAALIPAASAGAAPAASQPDKVDAMDIPGPAGRVLQPAR